MPGRLAGISSFFIDGVPIDCKGTLEYQTTNTKREPIVGMDGRFVGYKEMGEPPYMSVEVINTGAFTSGDMFAGIDVQLVAQLANGGQVTGHSMTMMDQPEVKGDEATFTAKWVGVSVEEAY